MDPSIKAATDKHFLFNQRIQEERKTRPKIPTSLGALYILKSMYKTHNKRLQQIKLKIYV